MKYIITVSIRTPTGYIVHSSIEIESDTLFNAVKKMFVENRSLFDKYEIVAIEAREPSAYEFMTDNLTDEIMERLTTEAKGEKEERGRKD